MSCAHKLNMRSHLALFQMGAGSEVAAMSTSRFSQLHCETWHHAEKDIMHIACKRSLQQLT